MGFLDSIIGGSKSSSSSTSGYHALTGNAQQHLADISFGSRYYLDPVKKQNDGSVKINQNALNMFTPMGQTADETKALSAFSKGFAPTPESLKTNIDMQMNPYDAYVTDEINRQAQGQNSILQENMSNAGAMGSNRQMFGASDLERDRLSTIGQFKQSEYNTALSNALTTIPGLQQQDATNQLNGGAFQRALDLATKQAPLSALQASAGLAQEVGLGAAQGGSSTSTSSGSSSSGLLGALGGAKGVGSVIAGVGALSDKRAKENIRPAGEENGHNIYEFNYKGIPDKYIGVIAQEVLKKNPEAVANIDGWLVVDYDRIGVKFRRQHDA